MLGWFALNLSGSSILKTFSIILLNTFIFFSHFYFILNDAYFVETFLLRAIGVRLKLLFSLLDKFETLFSLVTSIDAIFEAVIY